MGSAKFGRGGLAENDGAGFAQRPNGRVVALGKLPRKASQPVCVSRSLMSMDMPSIAARTPSLPARRTRVSYRHRSTGIGALHRGHIAELCVTFIGAAGQSLAWIDHAIYAARTAPRQEGNSNAR
jgi:hypothetical protein